MIKRRATGFMMLLAIMIFMFEPSFAARNSDLFITVTTGSKKIINHNIQLAKQTAVSDALDIAVQNAFISLVSRQVMASNLDFFYDQILSNTSDYIITYRVLGGIENKAHYLVSVETKIDLVRLEQTLTDARILHTGDKPVILFFIVEKLPSELLSQYWWGNNPIPYQSLAEKIIINKMIQEQFIITGKSDNRPDPSFYNITFTSIYDVEAAKNLGREMKADMIIFGKAGSSEAINRMGEEKTFNADITLTGYYLATGEKVVESKIEAAAKSDTAAEGSILALSRAANLSAIDLTEKINTFWMQNLRKEQAFDVKIEGENFLTRFIALKQKFKQMPGIENMQPLEMGSDYAILQIFYKGQSSQFADMLMLKTFDSFGLEISDVNDDFMNIGFIENDQPLLLEEDTENSENPIKLNLETNQ